MCLIREETFKTHAKEKKEERKKERETLQQTPVSCYSREEKRREENDTLDSYSEHILRTQLCALSPYAQHSDD